MYLQGKKRKKDILKTDTRGAHLTQKQKIKKKVKKNFLTNLKKNDIIKE